MKKLLIVDDEEDIVDFLREFFESRPEKYEIKTAHNGPDALKVYQSFMPDCLLLDIKMQQAKGKMNGLDVLRKIRQTDAKTKIIMVTAMDSREMIGEAIQAGANDYIVKPLYLDYLEKTVLAKLAEPGK